MVVSRFASTATAPTPRRCSPFRRIAQAAERHNGARNSRLAPRPAAVVMGGMDLERFTRCSDTWKALALTGRAPENLPREAGTLASMQQLADRLLVPLESEFGPATVTYGFAGPELIRAVYARAHAEQRTPNVTPTKDQHAGHELTPTGARICKRDGFAVDLCFPGHDPYKVAEWIVSTLPYDRVYLFGRDRPMHLTWAPDPARYVVEMRPRAKGGGHTPVLFRSGPLLGEGLAEALRRGVPFG